VPYRLLVFVQLTGALVMAAGIPVMFEERHPTTAVRSDKPVSMFGRAEDFQTAIATLLTGVDRRRELIEAALGR
jgi:hypothetical protein